MPQSRRQSTDGQFPGSIRTQARVVAEELDRIEYLRTRCAMKQAANGHPDDHEYAAAGESGEVDSYKAYRAALDAFEKKLKDITPPAAWRLAQKQLAQATREAEAA